MIKRKFNLRLKNQPYNSITNLNRKNIKTTLERLDLQTQTKKIIAKIY